MGVEELCLTWDDHHKTVVGVFEKLLESGALVDCTIAAEGQYVKAHKVVLSACSPYFEMLFTQENEKNPIVVLKDITFQDLRALIDFIYRGKVQIPEDRLGDFTDAAETLQIKGLGGGHRRRVLDKQGTDSLRKEGLISPAPRKRLRKCYSNEKGQNVRGGSPESAGPSSRITENPLQRIIPTEEPSCSMSALSSASGTTISILSQALRPQEEASGSRVLVSNARLSGGARSKQLTEMYVPETEDLIVPKNEVCVEETPILESEDEVQDVILGEVDNEESSNSVYSSAQGITKDDLDNSYLLGPVAEHSNAVLESQEKINMEWNVKENTTVWSDMFEKHVVDVLKSGEKMDPYIKRTYFLVTFDGVTKVARKRDQKLMATKNNVYTIIKNAHEAIGHAGAKHTSAKVKKLYGNIPVAVIKTFIEQCEHCAGKHKEILKELMKM